MSEYKEDCYDKVRWNEIDQLHEATLQISNNCFGYKKMCISLLVAGVTFITKFHSEASSYVLEVGYLMLISGFGFWICDANAYYFQKKNRNLMATKVAEILTHNTVESMQSQTLKPTTWFRAFFNHSMWLYYCVSLFGVGVVAVELCK